MPKADYPILLTRHLEALKLEWKKVSEEVTESCKEIYPEGSELINEFAKFLEAPGKFIRPSMFLFGCTLDNGNVRRLNLLENKSTFRLAIAFELLHTYLLIHDDIMDASDFRRGVPSVHKLCETYHCNNKLRGSAEYFGISMAILFGDIISAKAMQLWSEAEVAGIATPAAHMIFDQMHTDVCLGQYLDLMVPLQNNIPSKDVVEQIMREKTSKYTMTAPLTIGATIAQEQTDWIPAFGTNLGIAYQVADDILGVYGETSVTGKSVDSDIREGKATFLVWAALESASPEDKKTITDFYTGNSKNDELVKKVKDIFDNNQVRSKAGDIATKYMNKAIQVLAEAPITDDQKSELATFATFVVTRNK